MCDFELGWHCSYRDRQDPASRERLRLISLPLKKCNCCCNSLVAEHKCMQNRRKEEFCRRIILLISEYSLNRVRVLLGNKDNLKFKNIA